MGPPPIGGRSWILLDSKYSKIDQKKSLLSLWARNRYRVSKNDTLRAGFTKLPKCATEWSHTVFCVATCATCISLQSRFMVWFDLLWHSYARNAGDANVNIKSIELHCLLLNLRSLRTRLLKNLSSDTQERFLGQVRTDDFLVLYFSFAKAVFRI